MEQNAPESRKDRESAARIARPITDKQLASRPQQRDLWFTDPGRRGAGRLTARITPAGERQFYFRYTKGDGKRDTLLLGPYSQRPVIGSLTVAQARARAAELSALIAPINADEQAIPNLDIRAHFAAIELKKQEEATRQLQEQRRAEAESIKLALDTARREISVRRAFDECRANSLQPHVRADGKRIGRKDGGKYIFEQFERHVFPTLGDVPMVRVRKPLLPLLRQLAAEKDFLSAILVSDDSAEIVRFLDRAPPEANTRPPACRRTP